MKWILASGSPRRKELMKMLTEEFSVCVSDVDEAIAPGTGPCEAAMELAGRKAAAVAEEHPEDLVIGCDTIVVVDGEILGKPSDEGDAFRMLELISGRTHEVITGCCICRGGRKHSFFEKTEVEFYDMSPEEIREYIATGEPMDKAGAYGIQGRGGLFVRGIRGDYNNVVGMPVARIRRELLKG